MTKLVLLSIDKHNTETAVAEDFTTRLDALVEREFPTIKGWRREVTKGGWLANGNVCYQRETADFSGTIVVFIVVDQLTTTLFRVSFDVTAVLAEKLFGDERYYTFDGSFLSGLGNVLNARIALRDLANRRRSNRRDFS